MTFYPHPNDPLPTHNVTYRIAEHPAAPDLPHGQEGRAGTVYRLIFFPTLGSRADIDYSDLKQLPTLSLRKSKR